MSDTNSFDLLREEMESDETHLRVNAIHRLKIVATLMSNDQIKTVLLPYIDRKTLNELFFNINRNILLILSYVNIKISLARRRMRSYSP